MNGQLKRLKDLKERNKLNVKEIERLGMENLFTHYKDDFFIHEEDKSSTEWRHPVFDIYGWAYPNERKGGASHHKYGWRCQNWTNLKLGYKVDVGCFTYMNALYGIEIGDNVQIGSNCSIYSVNTENKTKGKVVIGKNSLIGSHCLILPGVVIPENSKIHAFSVLKSKNNKSVSIDREGWDGY